MNEVFGLVLCNGSCLNEIRLISLPLSPDSWKEKKAYSREALSALCIICSVSDRYLKVQLSWL